MNIQVLTDTLPSNGYSNICRYYNQHKPTDWMPLSKAGIYEGGFEVRLSQTEIDNLKQRYQRYLDPNEKVRQYRWNNGWLCGMGYVPLNEDETLLLYKGLQNILGETKVDYKKFSYNKEWWENQLSNH
jgi:hypothetical protein